MEALPRLVISTEAQSFCLATALNESATLPFVIPSSQLACDKLREKMTLAIATEARPGGPTAKCQPSPEGLGNQFRRGSERRRCGTMSLGAKPRDLQFYRRVLETSFDRVPMQVDVKVWRAYGARTMLGIRCPSPAGLGSTVWRSALRAQAPDRP